MRKKHLSGCFSLKAHSKIQFEQQSLLFAKNIKHLVWQSLFLSFCRLLCSKPPVSRAAKMRMAENGIVKFL
jgi:hypothetical protein